jgi:hypothetical protein
LLGAFPAAFQALLQPFQLLMILAKLCGELRLDFRIFVEPFGLAIRNKRSYPSKDNEKKPRPERGSRTGLKGRAIQLARQQASSCASEIMSAS